MNFKIWLENELLLENQVDEIYQFFPTIVKFLYNKTGDRELAEEIAQEAMYKAVKFLDKNDKDIEKIEAWLFTIARNALFNYFRNKKTTKELDDIEYNPNLLNNLIGSETSQMLRLHIKNMLMSNDEFVIRQGKALQDFYFNHKSVAEIAKEYNLPVGTIKRTLYKARERLKSEIGSF